MHDDVSDRHALLAQSESVAREISELSESSPMAPEIRRRIAELKILLEGLRARLQAMEVSPLRRPEEPPSS